MRLLSLDLINIGPFDEAHLDLQVDPGGEEAIVTPVTFVTGENGTGKSIIIDAIRAVFGPDYGALSRPITRDDSNSEVRAELYFDGKRPTGLYRVTQGRQVTEVVPPFRLGEKLTIGLTTRQTYKNPAPAWIVDYWQTTLGDDSFAIESLRAPDHKEFLRGSLQGQHKNQDTTLWICHIDYLRNSEDEEERRDGESLFQAFQEIARACIPEGRFAHVARSRLEPMFEQRGQLLGIHKLSAGSLYLMTRMLGLLARMYSCYVMSKGQGTRSVREIPGLLLIDEAENHLHPRWQKRFIPMIRELFPRLQLVVATHSPFILASVRDARVYVCRSDGTTCHVDDVSAEYADRPIDEILMSPVFAETRPFSQEITDLLDRRKAAIESGDNAERARIEQELLARNPDYFDYLNIESLLGERLSGVGS